MAKDVFPELVHEQNEDVLELKKHNSRAEATLIAAHGHWVAALESKVETCLSSHVQGVGQKTSRCGQGQSC